MTDEIRIPIKSDVDVIDARRQGRELCAKLGFSGTDLTLVATAISEIARNIVEYAKQGEIVFNTIQDKNKKGISITALDNGPGITNISQAMQDGYTTGKGLGLGLPGAKRMMDEFEIKSEIGKGTKVIMKKWITSHD